MLAVWPKPSYVKYSAKVDQGDRELWCKTVPPPVGTLLFHLISQLHEQTCIMNTTNLAFSEWVNLFADEKMTAALLDRLVHHCEIFETRNEYYWFKNRS